MHYVPVSAWTMAEKDQGGLKFVVLMTRGKSLPFWLLHDWRFLPVQLTDQATLLIVMHLSPFHLLGT
uniref:Uncharacterized protein n=1 Tax=Amphimedon queenslandica TaxID=400682 RepID=A0A1X7UTX7_AMPQE